MEKSIISQKFEFLSSLLIGMNLASHRVYEYKPCSLQAIEFTSTSMFVLTRFCISNPMCSVVPCDCFEMPSVVCVVSEQGGCLFFFIEDISSSINLLYLAHRNLVGPERKIFWRSFWIRSMGFLSPDPSDLLVWLNSEI